MARRASRARTAGDAAGRRGPSLPLLHLYFVWALTLLELHFFLASAVAPPLVRMVYLGFPPLLLVMAVQSPMILVRARSWTWYPPLLLLLLVAVVGVPFAANKALARDTTQYFVIYYVLALGTAVYVRTPRQALPIVAMLVFQFAWYGAFAGTKGLVPWHTTLANNDGFGALMVGGAGLCYWFATGARNRKVRVALYLLAAYCVVGVVASYARAAFLTLVAVVGWVWVRSPRKLMTAVGIGVAGILTVAAASLIFDPGFFYNEIVSAFQEGTTEGTGAQRWEVWKVALRVFARNPVIGAGAGNVGAFAAGHFRPGELAAFPNPNMLYGFNLHNGYLQILSELGLIGTAAFVWLLWDFFARNRQIRAPAAAQYWAEQTGGKWELRYLALGLEAANVANMLGAVFYASLFTPAFFTIWAANLMLWAVTRPPTAAPVQQRRRASLARTIPLPPGR